MPLFNTHTCEVYVYDEDQAHQCQHETQTRCDTCRRWCCVSHREDLSRGLRRRVTLCSICLETRSEENDES